MKKQITSKLQLSKETLRNLSARDLKGAVGGITQNCPPTSATECSPCPTESCSDGSCSSWRCC